MTRNSSSAQGKRPRVRGKEIQNPPAVLPYASNLKPQAEKLPLIPRNFFACASLRLGPHTPLGRVPDFVLLGTAGWTFPDSLRNCLRGPAPAQWTQRAP